jgi:hypothetical protein
MLDAVTGVIAFVWFMGILASFFRFLGYKELNKV